MMQIAGVVQDIFRSLGIDGWETVGTEPADAASASRSTGAGVDRPRSRVARDSPRRAAMARMPAEPSAEPVVPSHADGEAGAAAETALAAWLTER